MSDQELEQRMGVIRVSGVFEEDFRHFTTERGTIAEAKQVDRLLHELAVLINSMRDRDTAGSGIGYCHAGFQVGYDSLMITPMDRSNNPASDARYLGK